MLNQYFSWWTDKRMNECKTEHMIHENKIKVGKAIKSNIRIQTEAPSSSFLTCSVANTMSHGLCASNWVKSAKHASTKRFGPQARTAGLKIKLTSTWHNIRQITAFTGTNVGVTLVPYRLLLKWNGNLTLKMTFHIQCYYLRTFSNICFP